MRDVRRRERLAGTKRTSRRDNRGQSSAAKLEDKAQEQEDQSLVLRAASQEAGLITNLAAPKHRDRPTHWTACPLVYHWSLSPRSLPTAWFCDPFCSLPGSGELPLAVDSLVFYCM